MLLLNPSCSHESSLVANWRKFTSLATIPAIKPTHQRSANSYLNRGLRDTRYIGRAEGMHRLDRPFMKASWDKTLEGVPTPEGDDVLASKLPIVSWEKGRGSCWKVTWLRWFVELHSIWIFLYYGLSLFSWIYLHIFNDTW